MSPRRVPLGRFCISLVAAALLVAGAAARAQEITEDMVGQDEKAWQAWSAAMQLLERGKFDDAKKGFDAIADMKLSDLRLALMADRTGTLRFEEAVKDKKLGDAGTAL